MPIIISKNGKNAKRVEKTSFKKEEEFMEGLKEVKEGSKLNEELVAQ